MVILFKLGLIVLITVVLISLDGMMTLQFGGYEIYMETTTFGVLMLLMGFALWKIARVVDWVIYVPKNFLHSRKLQRQVAIIDDVAVACIGDDLIDIDKSFKNLNNGIKNSVLNKLLNAKFENKNQRINTLKTIFDSEDTDPKLRQVVALELLKTANPSLNSYVLKKVTIDGVLPAWVSLFQAINENDITTAKSTLHLAKTTGLSSLKYSLYEAYIYAKFNDDSAVEKIITAWKKIHNDNYLNLHILVLFKAVMMLQQITIKQFKQCEKSIHKTKWQGCALLSILALKNGIYGLANDYLKLVQQMDGADKFITLITMEISLASWAEMSDEDKQKALEKSIKYIAFQN